MSLPPVLLARLQSRGLVPRNHDDLEQKQTSRAAIQTSDEENEEVLTATQNDEEEVFAEDYGDGGKEMIGPRLPPAQEKALLAPHEPLKLPAPGCPNKWNAHHCCVGWCLQHWGKGIITESPADQRKRERMLRKYPLPSDWSEEYDPGTGRFYYYHQDGKRVCWLSPEHPRAEITIPAQKFREVLSAGVDDDDDDSAESVMSEAGEDEPLPRDSESRHDRANPRRVPVSASDRKRKASRDKNGGLDPMDPAAYSDTCPRGGWSAGLDNDSRSRAADTTAAGPHFQMRPYPSPGDVLRMHKKSKPS